MRVTMHHHINLSNRPANLVTISNIITCCFVMWMTVLQAKQLLSLWFQLRSSWRSGKCPAAPYYLLDDTPLNCKWLGGGARVYKFGREVPAMWLWGNSHPCCGQRLSSCGLLGGWRGLPTLLQGSPVNFLPPQGELCEIMPWFLKKEEIFLAPFSRKEFSKLGI